MTELTQKLTHAYVEHLHTEARDLYALLASVGDTHSLEELVVNIIMTGCTISKCAIDANIESDLLEMFNTIGDQINDALVNKLDWTANGRKKATKSEDEDEDEDD